MKTLPTEFKKNGFDYRVIDRTNTRYLIEVFSGEYNRVLGYETGRIITQKAKDAVIAGNNVHFENRERIPTNEEFGKDQTGCEGFWTTKAYAEKDFRNGIEADNKKAPVAAEAEDEYEDEDDL